MESKNLNDIVIEDSDNSKKAQLKNILTLLALLFIILVISIVITKLILGGDDENSEGTKVEGNKTELTQSDSSSGLSDGTVATAATAAALATTAAIATSSSKDVKDEPKKPLLTERNTTSRKRPSLRDHDIKKSSKKVETKKSTTTKHSTTTKRAYVPKRRNTTHVTNRATPVTKRPSASATRGYYIKVGAFKDPTSAIHRVKANHLRYKKVVTKNGMSTRVLVGPYYSHKDAQNDLTKVKRIAADAYITKIQ
ncbi:membrane protein [hydrothermal vent metagenome]|uniref:Membrane protein n=1 Tax=hydrothermal vent metagenome TaxID=652676 RepID=A0A1W1D1K6_9ZZZZ